MISKQLLSEVLDYRIDYFYICDNNIVYYTNHLIGVDDNRIEENIINIYELAHKNLKEWAKLKSVFDIIDWSEEPEQIFKKAEELRNEIN